MSKSEDRLRMEQVLEADTIREVGIQWPTLGCYPMGDFLHAWAALSHFMAMQVRENQSWAVDIRYVSDGLPRAYRVELSVFDATGVITLQRGDGDTIQEAICHGIIDFAELVRE